MLTLQIFTTRVNRTTVKNSKLYGDDETKS